MEYIVVGILIGYILFPISEFFSKRVANMWDEVSPKLHINNGCAGNCNQGRLPCDCRE